MTAFPEVFLLLGMALLTAAGQLLLRRGAVKIVRNRGGVPLLVSFINPWILGGLMAALAAPLLYIRALEGFPLSRAFMFNSLSHLFVFLAGRYILKEKACILHWLGLCLIVLGFLLPVFLEGIV